MVAARNDVGRDLRGVEGVQSLDGCTGYQNRLVAVLRASGGVFVSSAMGATAVMAIFVQFLGEMTKLMGEVMGSLGLGACPQVRQLNH